MEFLAVSNLFSRYGQLIFFDTSCTVLKKQQFVIISLDKSLADFIANVMSARLLRPGKALDML